MNPKQIGIILLIAGIILASIVYFIKAKDDFYIDAIIQERNSCYLSDGTCLHEDRNYSLYIISWVISGMLAMIGFYLIFSKADKGAAIQKEKPGQDLPNELNTADFSSVSAKLEPNEKAVFEKVIESQGTIFQSELVEKTAFSKVKVTRILDKLEGKGLIERKRRGMTNVVILRR